MDENEALDKGSLVYIGEEIVTKYIERVKDLCINKDLVKEQGKDLKIIYTPLNGTGNKPVRRVLKELGFQHVSVVPQQELPDPDFSTVGYPNPEDKKVFALGIELAREKGADLIIATDPDCDRVGVVVRNNEGEYITLSGNQTGALLVYYVLNALNSHDRLPENGCIVKSIVTSEIGRVIADYFDITTMDTLTGFKFICGKAREFDETGSHTYLLGYEESYGYVVGDFVRDKDAVIASMFISEMAAWYQSKGMTLYEGLLSLWEKYAIIQTQESPFRLKARKGWKRSRS